MQHAAGTASVNILSNKNSPVKKHSGERMKPTVVCIHYGLFYTALTHNYRTDKRDSPPRRKADTEDRSTCSEKGIIDLISLCEQLV